MPTTVEIQRAIPELSGLPWVPLGELPTPIERLAALEAGIGGGPLWVKRDDVTGAVYGGNKVRTLEPLFGEARARGATRIWATGAYGSNHAVATAAYARSAGFEPGAILFPQPKNQAADDNMLALAAFGCRIRSLIHWAALPFAMWAEARRPGSYVMAPGGATPIGALGYVSAALEVARQVGEGQLDPPGRILIGLGSTCSTAGLLAGFALASRLEPRIAVPWIWAVRVTPWPVTAGFRVVSLAAATVRLVARAAGRPDLLIPRRELASRLVVIGDQLGRGYGHPTAAGLEAIRRFADHGGPGLDPVYSGKVGAALLARPTIGPALFWATKSTRALPHARQASTVDTR